MNRLILFDTSNFANYPVGGQVTSIKNFLHYVGEKFPTNNILLVGVSTNVDEVGKLVKIKTEAGIVSFIPVAHANQDLNAIKKSLRVEYLKGLYRYKKVINVNQSDCMYLHTPEAFVFTRVVARKNPCFVFSHGSYLNMLEHVRFFEKSPIVLNIFKQILLSVIKKSTGIFVLDKDTEKKYLKYSNRVYHVDNSIVCNNKFFERNIGKENPRLLFVGRLSSVKNIKPIIEACKIFPTSCSLKIVGAGEMDKELRQIANERVYFAGAVKPDEVKKYMMDSDILVMNSLHEGIPMTILEALSYSMPIITTDVGGISEVVSFEYDSEKTDGSAESIVEAINKIMRNYYFYSSNAFKKSLNYDYRIVNKKIFEIINQYLKWEI